MNRVLRSGWAAVAVCAAVVLGGASARADIVVPGADGSDGALNIVADTVIDLSQAVTGNWDANNAANAGKGVYDPKKWAVIFKYSSVTVAKGKTVRFKNHASRAPVVWLVNGNVTIDGTVSLDGEDYQPAPFLAEPGPGGFRGGAGGMPGGVAGAAGFGPGGGGFVYDGNVGTFGEGAGYGATILPNSPTKAYGNASIIPLIGGSGGGGYSRGTDFGRISGGGGGGALLLACNRRVKLDGQIRAGGGAGAAGGPGGNNATGGGSGGAIRIVCSTIDGSGTVTTPGGVCYYPGTVGRIRVEREIAVGSVGFAPEPSAVSLAPNSSAQVWPPDGGPEVRILSIGSVAAPGDPRAGFGATGADLALPLLSPINSPNAPDQGGPQVTRTSVKVIVETVRVEQGSKVTVRGTPRSNGNYTEVPAKIDTVVSLDPLVIRWTADLPVNVGYSAVQVKVVRP